MSDSHATLQSLAAQIQIICPRCRHTEISKGGRRREVSNVMVWSNEAHGWVCGYHYPKGEKGRNGVSCGWAFGLARIFDNEDAATLLECRVPIERLELSIDALQMVRRIDMNIPWLANPFVTTRMMQVMAADERTFELVEMVALLRERPWERWAKA